MNTPRITFVRRIKELEHHCFPIAVNLRKKIISSLAVDRTDLREAPLIITPVVFSAGVVGRSVEGEGEHTLLSTGWATLGGAGRPAVCCGGCLVSLSTA